MTQTAQRTHRDTEVDTIHQIYHPKAQACTSKRTSIDSLSNCCVCCAVNFHVPRFTFAPCASICPNPLDRCSRMRAGKCTDWSDPFFTFTDVESDHLCIVILTKGRLSYHCSSSVQQNDSIYICLRNPHMHFTHHHVITFHISKCKKRIGPISAFSGAHA